VLNSKVKNLRSLWICGFRFCL
jgi:hypothetical protein